MKQHKSQFGFTTLHVLLGLVIVGIIGFAGWKVYNAGKTANTAGPDTPASVVKKGQPNQTTSTLPEGFVEYQNKDLGFKFAYPKEWGDLTVKDARMKVDASSEFPADTGKRWLLKFSNENNASLGLTSKDWSASVGRGGSCSFADGSAYKTLPTFQDQESDVSIQKVLDKNDRYYLVESGSVAYCQNLALYITYIFKANPTYLTLQFEYDAYQFKDENDFKVFKASPDKYAKPELVKTIEQIAKTIQDL